MDREALGRWIEASERPMLVAAAVAVAVYLADLAGMWDALGLAGAYHVLSLVLDLAFVVDLSLKVAVNRGAYLRSPWALIDVLSTLPILSTLTVAPSVVQALRFVRMLRVLRALRMLRVLRTLRILRVLNEGGEHAETRTWHRALTLGVLAYAAVFVALVGWARTDAYHGRVLSIEGVPVQDTLTVEVRDPDGTVSVRELTPEQLFADPDRQELLLVLGTLLGLGLMLVVARYQIPAIFSRQLQALLNVALPDQVATWLLKHPDAYDTTVRMPATVIFCDIKGFTATTETLELADLKHHLEAALDAVVEAHRKQDLIIDKFIGDAVMSFRGGHVVGGEPEDIAYRVVRGALNGIAALRDLGDPYFKEVKVGGASSDGALIGAFGTSQRLSYTVLGDKVNLASRLEGACNVVGVSNLFDDDTQRLTAGRSDLRWRRVGLVAVQGRVGVANAWEAFDAGDDLGWLPGYHRALEALEERRFDDAIAGFQQVLQLRPDDGPSARWLAACGRWMAGVGDGWQPVLKTQK